MRSRSGKAYAGIDGEALELDTPLEFRIHPRGLRLLVPEGNLTAAEQRRARDISARDLVDIARGRDPRRRTVTTPCGRAADAWRGIHPHLQESDGRESPPERPRRGVDAMTPGVSVPSTGAERARQQAAVCGPPGTVRARRRRT